MNGKRLLLISKPDEAKEFVYLLNQKGVDVEIMQDFKEALAFAKRWRPGVIVFFVPVYWESIVGFVEEVKNDIDLMDTQILYIGKLIEGGDINILQHYGVKTMALGPVPPQEMVRFMDDMFTGLI